ncbi:MAG: type II secretion system protein [Sumerlaeia bacterium]
MTERFARGFSLTELLVVLGLLSAAAAVGVPALLKAREQAHGPGCPVHQVELEVVFEAGGAGP